MTTTNVDRLLAIMNRLRDPRSGCPWDREQTFETIAPYTIEEAYEVADAISRHDMVELEDELGDLLFQVVFHAEMAREAGYFSFDGVAAAICDKMIRRHPHVFGDTSVDSAQAQTVAWEEHKAAERRAKADGEISALDGVAQGLPALQRAAKLQKRAARVGFDWPELSGVLQKLREELDELTEAVETSNAKDEIADELGDVLFSCVNLARHAGIEPESTLRDANTKFERRFRRMEALLAEEGDTPEARSLTAMDAAWDAVKAEERHRT